METYLTIEDVAGILKVNKQSVHNWIDREGLPAMRVGTGRGRLRIRRSDLDHWVERGRIDGGAARDGPSAEEAPSGDPELRTALADSTRALANRAPEALIDSLRSLAEAAQALAEEIARSGS